MERGQEEGEESEELKEEKMIRTKHIEGQRMG